MRKIYAVRKYWPYEIWDLIYFSAKREGAQAYADKLNENRDPVYDPYFVEEWDLNDA